MTGEFLKAVQSERVVLAALAILVILFVVSAVSLIRLPRRVRLLAEAPPDAWLPGVTDSSFDVKLNPKLKRLAASFFRGVRPEVVGHREGRTILREPLPEVCAQWADRLKAETFAYLVGGSYTGIALIMTFGLIAWVLFNDVPRAIDAASGGAGAGSAVNGISASSASLASAVKKMGAKFLISSTGLFLAITQMFVLRRATRNFEDAVWVLHEKVGARFTDERTVALEHSAEQGRLLTEIQQTIREGNLAIQERLAPLDEIRPSIEAQGTILVDRLERLNAIEVSVKDLGTSVTSSLNVLIKEAMAEQIAAMLQDLRGFAEGIAIQMQQQLQGNFHELAAQLSSALRGIQETLKSQSGSEVERLLVHLQDAVSGGFASETRNMSAMLGDFQRVFPELSRQLLEVSGSLSSVMTGFEQQQREQKELVASLASATGASVQRITEDLAREGTNAMGRILGETNTQVGQVLAALSEAASRNVGHTATLSGELDTVIQRVTAVTQNLDASVSRAQELIRQADASLAASRGGVAALNEASRTLREASEGVNSTLRASLAARQEMQKLVEQQADLVTKTAEASTRMQSVWPSLLKDVSATIQTTTAGLTTAWTALAERLESATSKYGNEVGDKVEDLNDTVTKLAEQMRANRAR